MFLQHEDASVDMFEYLIEDNNLKAEFEKYNLYETDRTFIKEQIRGPSKAMEKKVSANEVNWSKTQTKNVLTPFVQMNLGGLINFSRFFTCRSGSTKVGSRKRDSYTR